MSSENTIYFYPGRGGHSHDGVNSSFIDTTKYSLFDFSWGLLGDPDRRATQTRNYDSFKDFIVNTINSSVLQPAGLVLQPGVVNGSAHIISRSIEANSIAANTLTANEISANTITSNELTANFVLVNTIIASNNFDGTHDANTFAFSNAGTTGWAITSSGDAVFTNGLFRGNLFVGSDDYWYSNGAFALGGNTGIYRNVGEGITLGSNVTILGGVTASAVSTPGIDIDSAGNLTASSFALYGNGAIVTSSGNFAVDAGGNLYAENATIYGEINATSGSISGNLVAGGTISSTDISGVNISGVNISGSTISGVNIDGSTIEVGTRILLPIDGGQIKLGTASGGSATQVYIYAEGSQGVYIDTSGLGSSWFAGATWYINLQEFVSGRYITGLRTFVGSGTTLVVDSGGYVNRASSKRELKDNIQDFSDISLIDKLRPVTFTWKKDPRPNRVETEDEKIRRESSANIGFIAEEVEEASDGLLSIYNHNEDGEGEVEMYKHLDITALSVANIKDLRARVSSLEARIAELEG